MNQPQYSSLIHALAAVPDPRKSRGKQLEWTVILGIIAAALLCQQQGASAIAQWTRSHAVLLLSTFRPARGRLPSESTLRRALQQLDVAALERCLAALSLSARSRPDASPSLRGFSVDGKHVRGAGAHGHPTILVSLVAHRYCQVVGCSRRGTVIERR